MCRQKRMMCMMPVIRSYNKISNIAHMPHLENHHSNDKYLWKVHVGDFVKCHVFISNYPPSSSVSMVTSPVNLSHMEKKNCCLHNWKTENHNKLLLHVMRAGFGWQIVYADYCLRYVFIWLLAHLQCILQYHHQFLLFCSWLLRNWFFPSQLSLLWLVKEALQIQFIHSVPPTHSFLSQLG